MLVEHEGAIRCTTVTEGNKFVISGSADTRLLVWSMTTGLVEHRFEGHTDEVMSVKTTADGSVAISGIIRGSRDI